MGLQREIIGFVGAIIHDQELPMFLWEEVCNMTVYVYNRSPHMILWDKTLEETFLGARLEIGHLRIFGCPVYIHVPVEKRMKLDPSKQKGIFLGYYETSKDYRNFFLAQRKIVLSIDIKFKERLTSKKYQDSSIVIEEEEQQYMKDDHHSVVSHTSHGEEELSHSSYVRRPGWLLYTLRDAGEACRSEIRELKPPRMFLNYMSLMSSIIDAQHSSFEEAPDQQVWRDSMVEEYTSSMRNDVWDIVSKLEEKSFLSYMWLYKTKNVSYGSIEKFKVRFVARRFSQKEGVDYADKFSLVTKYYYIQVVISIASIMRWRIHHMDVKTFFFNGIIEEEVYIEKHRGFEVHGRESCWPLVMKVSEEQGRKGKM
jgi:hypothetical protein